MTILASQYGNIFVGSRLHDVNGVIQHPLQRLGWMEPKRGFKSNSKNPPAGMVHAIPARNSLGAQSYTPWNDNSHTNYYEVNPNPSFW